MGVGIGGALAKWRNCSRGENEKYELEAEPAEENTFLYLELIALG